jgi:hypothetical protein
MKIYIRELTDQQALNELNFMNEIGSLSKKVADMGTNHKSEIIEKDFQIAQLEMRVNSMKIGSVRGNSSRTAFKNRFMDSGDSSMMDVSLMVGPPSVGCA